MKVLVDIDENLYNRIISPEHLICFTDPMRCEQAIKDGILFNDFLDKAYDELDNCDYGNSYIIIDGETYRTDIGYAFEGIELFINYLKKRWGKNES